MTVESEFKLAIRHQMLHPFWMTSSAAALIRFVWIRYSSHLLGFNKPWEAATYVTTRRLLEGGCMANSYRAGWVQRSAGDARIRFRMPRSLPRGTHCGVFVQDAGAGVMTFCHEVQGRCWSKKLDSGVASRKARRPDTARPCKSGTNDYINMTSLNFTLVPVWSKHHRNKSSMGNMMKARVFYCLQCVCAAFTKRQNII